MDGSTPSEHWNSSDGETSFKEDYKNKPIDQLRIATHNDAYKQGLLRLITII